MGNKAKRKPAAAQKKTRQDDGGSDSRQIVKWVIRGAIGAGVIALLALVVLNISDKLEAPDGVESFEITSAQHVQGAVAYEQDPPAGGPHNPVWQECGFYSTPIGNENGVHALEHGAVWITYDPALGGDDVATLAEYGEQSEVLVSPYPGLDAPVVASSWGNQIRLTGADDPDLEAFVVNFKNADAPEIQANCNDGRGLGTGSGTADHSG
jgi:hypothetical protein